MVTQNPQSSGPYSKKTMRVLGVTTAVLGVLLVAWGARFMFKGEDGGLTVLVIGAVVVAVAALGIPLAIRRGRM